MSKRDLRLFLMKVLEAIEKIERYIDSLSFEDFVKNEMMIDAVIRNLEIIVGNNYGERFYEEEHKNYPDRKIIGSETVDYPLSVWLANEKNDYVACSKLFWAFSSTE